MYIAASLDVLYVLHHFISFLSRNIDLEINFFHIYLKCSAEKSKEKKTNFDFNCVIVECSVPASHDVVVFSFPSSPNLHFAFALFREKSSVTPIFGIGEIWIKWLKGKRGREGRENRWAISGERGFASMLFTVVVFYSAAKKTCHMVENYTRANFIHSAFSIRGKKFTKSSIFSRARKWNGKELEWIGALENEFQQVREMFINTWNV